MEQPTLQSPDQVLFYASDFKRAYETAYYMKESLLYKFNQNKLREQFDKMQQVSEEEAPEDNKNKVVDEEHNAIAPTPTVDNIGRKHARTSSIDMSNVSKKSQKYAFPIPSPPVAPLYTHPALRERYFGSFEGGSPAHALYDQVWEKDATEDPTFSAYGAEPIQSVVDRTVEFILELDRTWKNKFIILVSHGDVCQIVQSVLSAIDPCQHRSLPHMENCDVRELLLVRGDGYTDFVVVDDEEVDDGLKFNLDVETKQSQTPLQSPANKKF
eukprot:UN01497